MILAAVYAILILIFLVIFLINSIRHRKEIKIYLTLHFSKLHALAWRCRKMLQETCGMRLGCYRFSLTG